MTEPTLRSMRRRRVLLGLAAAAAPGWLGASTPSLGKARVVIVGGGIAGAACARWLRWLAPDLRIVLVETNATVYSGFFCNTVIAGLNPLTHVARQPAVLSDHRIEVVATAATGLDAGRRCVHLSDGRRLGADAIVLAPGIAMRDDSVAGFDATAMRDNPPAWPGGKSALAMVRRRLLTLPPGGVIAVAPPAAPYRCPPGPYERVSLFAHVLSRVNPRAKILIADAKDSFSKQTLFLEAWARHYPGMIEWIGRQDGGSVEHYAHASQTLYLASGDRIAADWAHVIPQQTAGRLAGIAGLVDRSGWVPVDASDFSVVGAQGIYAVGDATQAQPMPKSAFSAYNQARACAHAIVASLQGREATPGLLANTCYSMVTPDAAFSVSSLYAVQGGQLRIRNPDSQLSPLIASARERRREAEEAKALYGHLMHLCYGR
ncbi:FAD-dependent oxidoreductase [Algiphilus sp.]|uniref:FAD-dependent oxidoreductase n=1 Tax=Algiphilus sp. TaxID=1872431 RepID=UPI003B519DFC